jgi:hypothetical protein
MTVKADLITPTAPHHARPPASATNEHMPNFADTLPPDVAGKGGYSIGSKIRPLHVVAPEPAGSSDHHANFSTMERVQVMLQSAGHPATPSGSTQAKSGAPSLPTQMAETSKTMADKPTLIVDEAAVAKQPKAKMPEAHPHTAQPISDTGRAAADASTILAAIGTPSSAIKGKAPDRHHPAGKQNTPNQAVSELASAHLPIQAPITPQSASDLKNAPHHPSALAAPASLTMADMVPHHRDAHLASGQTALIGGVAAPSGFATPSVAISSATPVNQVAALDHLDQQNLAQITQTIVNLGPQGGNARITMHPDSLGALSIQVNVSPHGVTNIHIIAATDAGYRAVKDSSSVLAQSMGQAGLSAGAIQISQAPAPIMAGNQPGFSPSMMGNSNGQGQQQGQPGSSKTMPGSENIDPLDDTVVAYA